jgi:hypothetical protein
LFPLVAQKLGRFLLFLLLLWDAGNAFALTKRSDISTAFVAGSILFMPARHTAAGIWLFMF